MAGDGGRPAASAAGLNAAVSLVHCDMPNALEMARQSIVSAQSPAESPSIWLGGYPDFGDKYFWITHELAQYALRRVHEGSYREAELAAGYEMLAVRLQCDTYKAADRANPFHLKTDRRDGMDMLDLMNVDMELRELRNTLRAVSEHTPARVFDTVHRRIDESIDTTDKFVTRAKVRLSAGGRNPERGARLTMQAVAAQVDLVYDACQAPLSSISNQR
jgi:hypothetical protein